MSKIARQLSSRKRRIKRRMKKTNDNKYRRFAEGTGPVIDVGAVQYELADKVRGVANRMVSDVLSDVSGDWRHVAVRSRLVPPVDSGGPPTVPETQGSVLEIEASLSERR